MRAKKKAPGKGFSLRASLVLALGLVLAALLAVMGYYIFGVRDTARRQAEESFQNLTEASRAQLERLLETSQKAAQTASYSAASQRFLLSEIPGDVIDAKSLAADVMDYVETLGDGFVDIVLLSVRGRKLSATNSYTDIVREAMAQSGIGEDLTFTQPVYSPVIEADGKQYIVYLTPVYGSIDGYRYRQNPILCGVVYDVETLSGSLIPASYEAGTAFLSAGTEVFGGTRPLAKAEENALPEIAEGVGSLFIGGERYLTGRVTVEGPGWELIYLVPESAAVSAIDQMRSLVVMLILLTALAPLLYAVLRNVWSGAVFLAALTAFLGLNRNLPILNGDALFYYGAGAFAALHGKKWVEGRLSCAEAAAYGAGLAAAAVCVRLAAHPGGILSGSVLAQILFRMIGVWGAVLAVRLLPLPAAAESSPSLPCSSSPNQIRFAEL